MKAAAAIVAFAVLLMAPSLFFGPIPLDSASYNAVWVKGFADGLARGEAYPRWLYGSFEGLGAPTFYFYPPVMFYLAGGLRLAGLPVGGAINGAALVAMIASGASMYGWLRFKGARPLLGALVYMAAPYHLFDVYKRAAIAEFGAFVWLPLIALGICAYPRRWAAPLLAVAFAGLIWTHLPSALLSSVFLIAPLMGREIWKSRDPRQLAAYAAAGLTGLLLAAPYLLPALRLTGEISQEHLWQPFFQPANWAPFIAPDVPTALFVWPGPIGIAWFIAGVGIVWSARKAKAAEPLFWGVLALICVVFGLALIPFFWLTPVIRQVQFPWRLFVVLEFAAASGIALWPRTPKLALQAAGVVAVGAYARLAVICAHFVTLGGMPEQIMQKEPDAPEYLPAGSRFPDMGETGRVPNLDAQAGPVARGPVAEARELPDGEVSILANGPGTVVVRRFVFPMWGVERDGRDVPVKAYGDARLMAFEAQPGAYRVVRRITAPERQGWTLGVAGLGALLLLAGLSALSRSRRSGSDGPAAASADPSGR